MPPMPRQQGTTINSTNAEQLDGFAIQKLATAYGSLGSPCHLIARAIRCLLL